MNKAVIIIPTYNERENIAKILPAIFDAVKHVRNWDVSTLVVDDNSPDGTRDAVQSAAKANKKIFLFENKEKQGLGSAYLKGMQYAIDHLDADVVFEMDADFQHDPELLPTFFQMLDEGADMVIGSRYIQGGSIPAHWGIYRKFLSIVGNMVNSIVFLNFRVRDWTSGYRAIRKKVFLAVQGELHEKIFTGYTFQIGFLRKALKKGFLVREVPLRFAERTVGQSKLGNDYIKSALYYIFSERIREIVSSRVFKFAVVGGIGFVINAVGLFFFTTFLGLEAGNASALGAEFAIISNFILNNFWTFSEERVTTILAITKKFIQFNIASIGAVFIQKIVVSLGTTVFGTQTKFLWFFIAVILGMFVNFFLYSKVIWKKKQST